MRLTPEEMAEADRLIQPPAIDTELTWRENHRRRISTRVAQLAIDAHEGDDALLVRPTEGGKAVVCVLATVSGIPTERTHQQISDDLMRLLGELAGKTR